MRYRKQRYPVRVLAQRLSAAATAKARARKRAKARREYLKDYLRWLWPERWAVAAWKRPSGSASGRYQGSIAKPS